MIKLSLKNRYLTLGEAFYQRTNPSPVAQPTLIKLNETLAQEMGIKVDNNSNTELASVFSGNQLPENLSPLSMAYAGHQFGHFNPQLGDGRAIYLGEITSVNNKNYDVQLKGSGPTEYSRNGDGRSALGPVLREYLVSEAMHQLNIPTTRALAAVTTGEEVARERLTPGGIFTRVASSFIRVGSFQYFSAKGDIQSVKALADYVIDKNFKNLQGVENPYSLFLKEAVQRQASLIAKWMQVGFIHGVMNTDNMSVAGETIDYGPCAFMDGYQHDQVYSSIDHQGRYAYMNQPSIGLWNLTRLAESLLPLLSDDSDESVEIAQGILKSYINTYEYNWLQGMRKKVGLTEVRSVDNDSDKALIESLLNIMSENRIDFTLTFFHLSQLNSEASDKDNELLSLFNHSDEIKNWLDNWRQRLNKEAASDSERQTIMQTVNPVYIPRNHQIEAAIRAAEDHNDFSVFNELHEVLQNPFSLQQGKEKYRQPPEPNEVVQQTFCGT